jgi:hypothetical protein
MGATNKQYAGTIILTVNGMEYEVKSVNPNTKTGVKAVATMNSQKRALGTSSGVVEYAIDIEAYIPLDGSEPQWETMTGATIAIYPVDPGGNNEIYMDCSTLEVGTKSGVGETATRSIKMIALDKQTVPAL